MGYDEIEGVGGVSVEVREMRDAQGGSVRGLLVRVSPDQYYRDLSFVDMDEIPGLLKGFDVLVDVKANPTKFESFEVQYSTRGGLQLTAFNNWNTGEDPILYDVRALAGRERKASSKNLSLTDMRKLRALFETALQKLASLGSSE